MGPSRACGTSLSRSTRIASSALASASAPRASPAPHRSRRRQRRQVGAGHAVLAAPVLLRLLWGDAVRKSMSVPPMDVPVDACLILWLSAREIQAATCCAGPAPPLCRQQPLPRFRTHDAAAGPVASECPTGWLRAVSLGDGSRGVSPAPPPDRASDPCHSGRGRWQRLPSSLRGGWPPPGTTRPDCPPAPHSSGHFADGMEVL